MYGQHCSWSCRTQKLSDITRKSNFPDVQCEVCTVKWSPAMYDQKFIVNVPVALKLSNAIYRMKMTFPTPTYAYDSDPFFSSPPSPEICTRYSGTMYIKHLLDQS
ncbi:hypothetical protein AVEN_236216-1 [Araneus ventricosus]|uniref:Uncharacterized protein n=1 Tax=Araneus ventricosus TaxID=182803 RepID=A0A4Y2CCF0_ARAVE|nr:hypothetical protein AVEN_236216-1 [Araneus ventricosus]